MITLGIECSSRQGSVALLKDGNLLAEKSWIADRVRHNPIFQTLETLREEAHISYNEISLYAVGRGPGSFSGMRMSLAIAQALALPNKTKVRAVSSGAALTLQVARTLSSVHVVDGSAGGFAPREIAVVGDARRGQVWIGFFNVRQASRLSVCAKSRSSADRLEACPTLVKDWELIPYEDVSIPEGTVVVSPEAERLIEIFPEIGSSRFPHAKEVAELAEKQTEPEPLEPLYMHPPVFIEPKFG